MPLLVRPQACAACVAPLFDTPARGSGKSSRLYAARQASCPLRCERCRRQWDVRFRWSWHQCVWVHAAETGTVLARPSVSVFGFPVSDSAPFHLTAVVSAPDAADELPAPEVVEERLRATSRDVESGTTLDFYGQADTTHSTRDYFRPGDPPFLNPFFRAT